MSEPGFEKSSPAPLDMQKLNENFMQNTDIIKTILSAFKDTFDDFETQFRDAEAKGDVELMTRLAHSLKGSAGNIRAAKIADKAGNLEHQIGGGARLNELDSSFDDLLESLDELNRYIDDFTS